MEAETPKGSSSNRATIDELSKGLKNLAALQEQQLVVDLDAAWEEHKKTDTPIVFKFQGKSFEVPSSMPADFGRFYRRHCLKTSKDEKTGEPIVLFMIPDGELLFDFMEGLCGKEFADAWSDTRIPMDVLATHVIGPIMRQWQLIGHDAIVGPVDGEEKKSQTPES